jgi:hypothetical protein
VGLVAREIERRGIPTLSLTSAWSITRAVGAPRAAFVDYPLGHTAGKPGDEAEQEALLASALRLFETLEKPGEIVALPFVWSEDDAWKDRVMRPDPARRGSDHADDRVARDATPQYQDERDRRLAEEAIARGGCETCVFPERDAPDAV